MNFYICLLQRLSKYDKITFIKTDLGKEKMWIADQWKDYEILDASAGEKLERWGNQVLIRPDPQVIWNTPKDQKLWDSANAHYYRSATGGGHWDIKKLPEVFTVSYNEMVFRLKPMGFKHTGLFPEQATNWDWLTSVIKSADRPVKVLNLFAYTGGASVACAKAGAKVCHVDASKGMTSWAKENAEINGINDIRFIVDDCSKFVNREIRRGNTYDGIIMDPPSYGRGPGGEIWKLENELYGFLELCMNVLTEKPLFFLLNSYTTGLSALCMEYMVGVTIAQKFGGKVTAQEIGLPVVSTGMNLPCGASVRWENK